MSSHSNYSRSGAHDSSTPSSYCTKVRSAHELAELLKRTRPHLCEQVTELQAIITRCQQKLDALSEHFQQAATCAQQDAREQTARPFDSKEYHAALEELETATQALRKLRHNKSG